MRTWIVTGGAGTGKSTFCGLMAEAVDGSWLFDCDRAVHAILTRGEVVRMVSTSFGTRVLDSDGRVDRGRLRDIVFADSGARERLEAILHPLVRQDCLTAREDALRGGRCRLFLIDVPLFYESGFPVPHDEVVVVAADPGIQRRRLATRTGLSEGAVEAIVSSQWPLERKITLAPRVAWNDGSLPALRAQVQLLAATIDHT